MNDVTRPGRGSPPLVDLEIYARLADSGATVVTTTFPDVARMLPVSRFIAGRILQINAVIRGAAHRHGVCAGRPVHRTVDDRGADLELRPHARLVTGTRPVRRGRRGGTRPTRQQQRLDGARGGWQACRPARQGYAQVRWTRKACSSHGCGDTHVAAPPVTVCSLNILCCSPFHRWCTRRTAAPSRGRGGKCDHVTIRRPGRLDRRLFGVKGPTAPPFVGWWHHKPRGGSTRGQRRWLRPAQVHRPGRLVAFWHWQFHPPLKTSFDHLAARDRRRRAGLHAVPRPVHPQDPADDDLRPGRPGDGSGLRRSPSAVSRSAG